MNKIRFNVNGYNVTEQNEVKNLIRNFVVNEVETNKKNCDFSCILSLDDDDWKVISYITKMKGEKNYHLVFGVYKHDGSTMNFGVDLDFGTLTGIHVNKLIGQVTRTFFKVIEMMFDECGVMTTDEKYFNDVKETIEEMVENETPHKRYSYSTYSSEYMYLFPNGINESDEIEYRVSSKVKEYYEECMKKKLVKIYDPDGKMSDFEINQLYSRYMTMLSSKWDFEREFGIAVKNDAPMLDTENADMVKNDAPCLDDVEDGSYVVIAHTADGDVIISKDGAICYDDIDTALAVKRDHDNMGTEVAVYMVQKTVNEYDVVTNELIRFDVDPMLEKIIDEALDEQMKDFDKWANGEDVDTGFGDDYFAENDAPKVKGDEDEVYGVVEDLCTDMEEKMIECGDFMIGYKYAEPDWQGRPAEWFEDMIFVTKKSDLDEDGDYVWDDCEVFRIGDYFTYVVELLRGDFDVIAEIMNAVVEYMENN